MTSALRDDAKGCESEMDTMHLGPKAADFVWASGIEDSFIPQTKRGHRPLDEYQLMGHYKHWREDLALAKDLGVNVMRWGVPWYRVEPLPDEYDWRWTDEVLPYMVEELGITPIIDLVHYGCPYWLRREFANEEYHTCVSRYAAAFAERYRHLVRWYTPCNEPLVNSLLSGMQGAWPPYMKGDRGYVKMFVQLAKGIISTVEAIKSVQPEAQMVHVEAAGICRAGHPDVEWLAEQNRLKGFLSFDLITGKITPEHPLWPWLMQSGARTRDLEWLARRPIPVDVMGLNFYPQWSTQELYLDDQGHVLSRTVEHDGSGFGSMVEDFYMRYGVPVMITETSARDAEEDRIAWLNNSLRMIKELRERAVPVLGYTWFPLFTMIEWNYRWERGPLERYLLDLGVYQLNTSGEGDRWRPLPMAEHLRHHIQHSYEAVGDLAIG
jgi:beta-glucosidase/6-phospho-beta-glucosidase/beta-galactosidase